MPGNAFRIPFDQTNGKILYTVDAFGLIANNANNEVLAFLK